MSSIGLSNRLDQSVVKMEQNARQEYFGQKAFESVYNWVTEKYNVLFTAGYVYGESNNAQSEVEPNSYGTQENVINAVSQSTSTMGGFISYTKGEMPLTSLNNGIIESGKVIDLYSTYKDLGNFYNNQSTDNTINLGLNIISWKSFPAWWVANWYFNIAPKLAPEIDNEGYRNHDKW
jgi:hypothetical protein